MRAQACDRLRHATLFFVSVVDMDGHVVLGSVWAPRAATLDFFFTTIASLWGRVSEVTGDSDAQIACQLMLKLAARRDGGNEDIEGRDAEEE